MSVLRKVVARRGCAWAIVVAFIVAVERGEVCKGVVVVVVVVGVWGGLSGG